MVDEVHRFDDMRVVPVLSCVVPSCQQARSSRRRPRIVLSRDIVQRLKEVFVVYLLSFLQLPVTMSAPASERLHNSRPNWINPCGLGSNDEDAIDDFGMELPQLEDKQLISQIVVQAKNALMHAEVFKNDYVWSTFHVSFSEHHDTWMNSHYDWLPSKSQIPKDLGEPVPQEYLEKLELNEALKNSYMYLQKFAVGLEQVVWDQADQKGDYWKQFKDTEYKLRAVLCEMQVAMLEKGVTQHDDVSRQIMTNEYRNMGNATYRNLRDWFIFRDYMNGLEYVIQVFEYFKNTLTH